MVDLPTIAEAQAELIDTFGMLPDWTDKYQYIIELGQQLPAFPDAWKLPEYKVHGCQSQVWMRHEIRDGRVHFDATSDAIIVCGLIALLARVYNDRTPREIVETPPDFIREIGLNAHLSTSRGNGLQAMLKRIRDAAVAAMDTQANPSQANDSMAASTPTPGAA